MLHLEVRQLHAPLDGVIVEGVLLGLTHAHKLLLGLVPLFYVQKSLLRPENHRLNVGV